ncbi:hypothetical protein Agub_g5534 [Astrephomene gubernaculifera]|uniref:DDE Tnp4 domain-containing protein n=1 Tax=Astrephomene gubernaculifera TaxID=47775 RepID=A0AAD3DM14_9CHLO|nr:hypothetical protein Agub_g5534 [Astrephomene gubernaculifera]
MDPSREDLIKVLFFAAQHYRQSCLVVMALAYFMVTILFPAVASFIMDSSDDDSEDGRVVRGLGRALPRVRYYPRNRAKRQRTEATFNSLDSWDDARFKYELHVSKRVFYAIVDACRIDLSPRGNRGMSVEEKVYIALSFLASGGSYGGLSRQAQRGRTTVHRCVGHVAQSICYRLQHLVSGPPRTQAEMAEIVAAFEELGRSENTPGIPNIFAVMDGSHIPIKRFHNMGEAYYNYKGFNSVLMHGVMDNKGRFMDVLVGFSGRNNDSTQFRHTQIYKDLVDGSDLRERLIAWGQPINGVKAPLLILADGAYEASGFILPPFKQPEIQGNPQRSKYNTKHAKARVVVEHGYGALKNRFRVLLKGMELSEPNVNNVILACTILHNMCIDDQVAEPDHDEMYYEILRSYERWNTGRRNATRQAVRLNQNQVDHGANDDVWDAEHIRDAIVLHVNRRFG